jgi:mRNA-degrading endonuclease RelE of RelBE toxin-antitoxin system
VKSWSVFAAMPDADISIEMRNPCTEGKDHCINCHSHFMAVRPHLKSVIITKRFLKDIKNGEKARSIVEGILDCSDADFYELHKFEEHIDDCMIFRAKKEGTHIVYCVNKEMQIIFLRAFRNFKMYEKFLDNKKEISRLIDHS